MSNDPNSLDSHATREHLLRLARHGILNLPALQRALRISGDVPDRSNWARFLDTLLLLLGAGSLVSGIFFLFAFNWAEMHRYLKLGLLEVVLLITVGLAFWRGLERLSGKIALGAACLLVGALLAVYGQAYQRGADAYQLFLVWAILITGWVLISKFTPLWFLWFVLINITLPMYWQQIVGGPNSGLLFLVFTLNAGAVLAWEIGRNYGVFWLRSDWPPRILALPALTALIISALTVILGGRSPFGSGGDPLLGVLTILYIGVSGFMLYAYSQLRLDLFMLTICAFGLMITLNILIFDNVYFGIGTVLLIGVLFIIQAALTVVLLRRVSAAWSARAP